MVSFNPLQAVAQRYWRNKLIKWLRTDPKKGKAWIAQHRPRFPAYMGDIDGNYPDFIENLKLFRGEEDVKVALNDLVAFFRSERPDNGKKRQGKLAATLTAALTLGSPAAATVGGVAMSVLPFSSAYGQQSSVESLRGIIRDLDPAVAESRVNEKRYDAVVEYLKPLRSIDPRPYGRDLAEGERIKIAHLYNELGRVFYFQKNYPEAIKNLEVAHQFNKNHPIITFDLAAANAMLKNYGDAERLFDLAAHQGYKDTKKVSDWKEWIKKRSP